MKSFIFDLQRFADVILSADESTTINGVTYTAVTAAKLKLDDDEKVSGMESGKVTAVVADAETSPTVTFDATDGAINFTATGNGEIITATTVLPIEYISGSFTFNGSEISISKGSDLAIVVQRENYSLRNENHFEYDSTYSFTGTAMTSDAERVISTFSINNGTEVRTLHLEQLGKVINNFTQRGVTLVEGSSEVLKLGDYTLKATATNGDAGLNFELGEKGMTFVPNIGDGKLNVSLSRDDKTIFAGELECTNGSITFGYDKAVTFAKDTTFKFTTPNKTVLTVTADGDATTNIALTDSGITFTPGANDGELKLSLNKNGAEVFKGSLNISDGTITFDPNNKQFSFTDGTKISLGIWNLKLDIKVIGDTTIGEGLGSKFKIAVDDKGNFIFTPDENGGSLNIGLSRESKASLLGNADESDLEYFFENNVTVKGPVMFNPLTRVFTLKDSTEVLFEFNNYTLTATAQGDAASTIDFTEDGISFTPDTEDKGNLKLTLSDTTGSRSLSADIEVLSGSFILGDSGALTVAKDTELQIKFSDDYIINFKATDKAGGSISLGTDGITFAPTSDDGGLQLTVKRGDDTRSASLDVTGSVTYKLDGSISLTQGTVVKNIFDDGNILTITANTDASGSINFNPQTGLTIKPTTTDALTVSLTTSDIEVVNITSIDGSITYQNGIVTATDGTKARITYYFGWKSDLYTKGGTASVQFTDDRTIYTANAGATFTVNYLDGTTTEIQHGSYADVYGETIEDYVELVSEGTTLKNNDSEVVFTLEKAGDYNLNGIDVTTSEDNTKVLLSGDYDTVQFAADAGITVSATEDKGFRFKIGDDGTITITTTDSGDFGVSSGSITFDDGQATIAKGTTISLTTDERVVTFTANKDIPVSSKIEEDIYYLTLDEATADVTIAQDGQTLLSGEMVIDGVFSYRPATGTFGLTGANSSHGDGNNTSFQFTTEGPTGTYTFKAETNDTTVVFIPSYNDGKFEMNFPNEAKNAMKFTVSKDGQTVFENNVAIDGTIGFDTAKQELSLTKDTVLTLTQGENSIEITALGDAGGKLNIVDGGLRFAPNTGDGELELNFVSSGRKANIDVTGAVIFGEGGKISLEDGTEVNFTWEDGNSLKLTSSGSTGSIGLDPERGIKITSDDENLSMTFTTPSMSTDISGIKGTIYYNAGVVSFDENSTITATTTLGGQPILTTLETIDGTGYISFNTTNGVLYSADTGALKITWTNEEGLESTFTINEGSVQIGHNLFRITEGSDIATDLKNFVPAFYFTTAEAGTYTINGQTITTSAEGLALTATDDYMVFTTSDDVVTYDGMTFTGSGNVSLMPDEVFLGSGVVANGFGKDNSFVLTEVGTVTADEKIFELAGRSYVKDGVEVEVPLEVTVTGAEDGFIFSRTLTEESEEAIEADPPLVGSIFTEKFISHGDSSYRTVTDPIGLEEVIGISDGATIMGGATLDGESTYNYFDIQTDTTGTFTIGERAYVISAGTSLGTKLTAHFDEEGQAYARGVKDLNGTVSGDFSAHTFEVNGSSSMKVINDTNISIVADDSGFEILGLDAGAKLQVSAADIYNVNGTEIAAGESSVIIATTDGSAELYTLPAALADYMLHKTEAGYPQMAALAFHPDEENPDAPTNYYLAEQWTTTSADNLQLSAIHYSPENPTGKWVILVHGYGKKGAAMNASAEPYLEQGIDVLIIDQRAAGNSEGDWLTMGVAEANDLAIWTQEIAKTNSNAQITLHGVSMGAATVMLSAALPETVNVSGIIEDCGYGNIADVFAALMYGYGSALGVSGVDFYELFDDVNEVAKTFDGGYDIADAAPIESIAAVTVPSLFIHGAADVAIPSTNADALYEASGASNKTKLIVEGAGHARSIEIDSDKYFTAVKELLASSTTEIGASIDSDDKNKLLRGTIYNDTITTSGTAVTIQGLAGDDYIVNNVDSSLVAVLGNSIDAGEGNDTIYSYHTYNPTLLGGDGDDSIVVEKGHITYIEGGTGNDTIIGVSQEGGWGMGNLATVLGGEGDDFINPIYSANASIDGGDGNDTIFANGESATIDGGTGNNLIVLTNNEGGVKGKFVVFNGNTTVESFNTGFESDLDPEMGEGTDTIYIDGDPAGVYFNDGVLVFANDNASLTMSDITTTAKVNIYHERRQMLNKGVFIAENDWYSVTSSDLSVNSGEEVYFVGPSANPNHGVDFSGISAALNVTMDTAYIDSKDYVPGTTTWINGVYSLKGGAGLTTITGSDKNDTIIAGTGSTTINAADGDDFISLSSADAVIKYAAGDGNDSIIGFNENSTLNISGAAYTSQKSGDDLIFQVGTDEITLEGAASLETVNVTSKTQDIIDLVGAKNVETIISASETGEKNIELEDGKLLIIEKTRAQVNVTTSSGEDTIYSNGENVSVTMSGGKTALFVEGGKMTVDGYDISTDSGFHTDYADIFNAVDTGEIVFDNGNLTIGEAVIIDGSGGNNLVNLFNANGKLQKAGEAIENTALNLSSETANWVLYAEEYSTLVGGSGNDSIFAFTGSFVDAGTGRNYIEVEERDANDDGVTIVLGDSGNNTIENFTTGFDETSDRLFFGTDANVDFKIDGTDLIVKNNDNSRSALLTDVADDVSFVNISAADDNGPVKIAVAKKESIIQVDDELADAYYGEKSGVDFTGYSGDLNLNLGSTETSIGAGEVLFSGINQITAGSGRSTVIGSDANETLIAGNGNGSLYGAGGRNVLRGYTGNNKEVGSTFFVLGVNDGAVNTIRDFEFVGEGDNSDTIEIDVNSNHIKSLAISGENLVFEVENSEGVVEKGILEGAVNNDGTGNDFQISGAVAQVGKNKLVYDNYADYYYATGVNASVVVDKSVEGSVSVWLDDPDSGKTFGGDIRVIDAKNATGNAELAGNNLDNTIYAGKGDTSLWGGFGGNDLLVGNSGRDTFVYLLGDGNDTIQSAGDGDSVILSGVSLENIVGVNFSNNALALNFSDGGKLTVNENGKDVRFVVGDQTFYVNKERNAFATEK